MCKQENGQNLHLNKWGWGLERKSKQSKFKVTTRKQISGGHSSLIYPDTALLFSSQLKPCVLYFTMSLIFDNLDNIRHFARHIEITQTVNIYLCNVSVFNVEKQPKRCLKRL